MVYFEICAEDPQQTWNRLKTVQRKRHKNIFADVRVTVCISTVQILTSNIIGSRSSSYYLSKQWRQEQEIQWSTSDGERREWERVTSDRLRIRLLKSRLASVPSSFVIGPKEMAAAKQARKWLTCVQASIVWTSRPWAANGNRKFFFSFDAFWHHRICNGKSPDIKTRVFQSKASSRNSATKGTVNFRLTLSVIKLCRGSCAFISMLSSMEVVSKLQRTRRH